MFQKLPLGLLIHVSRMPVRSPNSLVPSTLIKGKRITRQNPISNRTTTTKNVNVIRFPVCPIAGENRKRKNFCVCFSPANS